MSNNRNFQRIVIKISGEAMGGESGQGVDVDECQRIATEIAMAHKDGHQIAVVVGGGNFWRGANATGMARAEADYIGMNMTVSNASILRAILSELGCNVRAHSSLSTEQLAEPYRRLRAIHQMETGNIVVLGGGLGNPYFTTDTTTVVRAGELGATHILMAKNGVDGVYNKDPKHHPDAEKFEELALGDAIDQRDTIRVMDLTAMTINFMDVKLPITVYDGNKARELHRVLCGDPGVGTLVLP